MSRSGALAQRLPYLFLVALAVGVDQFTKFLIQSYLGLHESRPVIDGVLSLSHVRNRGAAFGLLSDADIPHQSVLFTLVGVAVFVGVVIYTLRIPATQRLPQASLALVIGGAVGNLIDRVRLGYVVDFVHVYWKQYQWWDFNVADACISVGIVLLVLDSLRSGEAEPAPRDSPGSERGINEATSLLGRGE